MSLTFFVAGTPAPQGSKRYLRPGVMVESSKRVAPWRADVRAAAAHALEADVAEGHQELLWNCPLDIQMTFRFPRPKSHYGTGRNAAIIKESAPFHHGQTPDMDKLARAINDALTGVVFADDKSVVRMTIRKQWADADEKPGVEVTVDLMP